MLTTYSDALSLMDDSGLSAEQFGDRMGLSGMTLRRWRHESPSEALPPLYRDGLVRAVHSLLEEGRVSIGSPIVRNLLTSDWQPFKSASYQLGLSPELLKRFNNNDDGMLQALSHIGESPERKQEVEKSLPTVGRYRRLGAEWKRRINVLIKAIRSKKLTPVDKLIAYGAFFYLFSTIDLIPDTIPVFGLMDDFFLIGLAVTFYLKRHPDLFKA